MEQKRLTLDLAGLSDEQRAEGAILIGGSQAEFVRPGDDYDDAQVDTLVYRWGDQAAERTFTRLLERRSPTCPDDMFPLSLATVIGDRLWLQALQTAEFDPATAYRSDDDYIEVPYNQATADEFIHEILYPGDRRRQAIGRIASRYVLFEMGVELNPGPIESHQDDFGRWAEELAEHGQPMDDSPVFPEMPERLSVTEVLDQVERLAESWAYDQATDHENSHFAFNVAYWLVETFGFCFDKGRHLSSRGDRPIDGQDLPAAVQGLVTKMWRDELYIEGANAVELQTRADYIENDPVIPRWDEVSRIETFEEQLNFIRANQDIIDGIEPTRIDVLPGVSVRFAPARHMGWGLEFAVNALGIDVHPFGNPGETAPAGRWVLEHHDNTAKLAETATRLALLGVRHAEQPRTEITGRQFENLLARLFNPDNLAEDQQIPLEIGDFRPNPQNAVKNLLIRNILWE